MKSQNFEFLRPRRSVLADLAGFAEHYAHSDPASSLIKQRSFVEHVVSAIYERYGLRAPDSDNLHDLMNERSFRDAVPEVVQNKLHTVRRAGNHAAHPRRPITSRLSLECLVHTFDLARWVHLQIDGGDRSAATAFVAPAPDADRGKARQALEKLRLAEAKYAATLAALEQERKKRLEAERSATENAAELTRLRAEGERVVSMLAFDEEKTRRQLIDHALVAAGWDVGPLGADTEQVRQEVPLRTMPTTSGEGYADYVLYGDDGKPLAVIEAKKTAKDARQGQEQARIYADCLERETGVRPVIFFTNGPDIYIDDDAQGYPDRKIYGFYSKDSLEYLLYQRRNKKPLASLTLNPTIAERMYQHEAIRRVCERFSDNFRRALVVQATGTGKTRLAISLCDLLMRAGWVKRILFLCDRRELRKQADLAFKEFMPGEPRVIVEAGTSDERSHRIYLATYPAMMKYLEEFDVGFFDLVICDEAHRSVYRKYRALFRYFDALQVGLTATPRLELIERNTYELFGCRDGDPTSNFDFRQAVNASPPFLVPFRVISVDTGFRRRGFRYAVMNPVQRAELEDQEPDAENVDFDPEDIDRRMFNKATTRVVWGTLMEEGIRENTGTHVGKTIVFARNHKHALHLADVFREMYPQYGSTFCRVIDNQEPRRDQLIDDFKNREKDLTIAISVDMLDTGIDVPEVVNLVFARPVRSYIKFWQMIGRGTRLCRDLFGPGRHKTEFLIFDHWDNFWYFDEQHQEKQPSVQKSLLQQLFEARIELAKVALDEMEQPEFELAAQLIVGDVRAVRDTGSIDVRDRWRELEMLSEEERIRHFAAATQADLRSIAPLQHHRRIRGEQDAYRFDLLVTRLQAALLEGGTTSPTVLDLRARVQEAVELLGKNHNPVKAFAEEIKRVRSKEFWASVNVRQLEEIRTSLRGVMKYQEHPPTDRVAPRVFDVMDGDVSSAPYIPRLDGLELVEYKRRVESVLREHFDGNPVLQRIRDGHTVSESELEELAKLVLQVDDKANIRHLVGHDPATRRSLLAVFRGLVGLDPAAVDRAFVAFVQKHPQLSAQQLRFLQLLQNHIAQNGGIELERLYEPPFTTIHAESVDGVFPKSGDVDELLAILGTFEPPKAAPSSD